jgi:DNA-binding CsgD family transcriptional regulator
MGREPPGLTAEAPVVDAHAAMWAAWGVGLLCLLVVDPAAVDQVLGPWARLVEDRGAPEPRALRFLTYEVEALVALGQLDRAERLTRTVEGSVVHPDRRARVACLRCRALLAAAHGDLDRADRLAAEALARCDALTGSVVLEVRLDVGRTYLAAGRIARRRKEKRRARELLERAATYFADPQCGPLRDRVQVELDRLGDRRHDDAGGDVLTATERQVAELTASGMRNRDVAGRLGISPKTVEVNLSRIYRKLGIHSRAELGAVVAAGGNP